MTLFGGFIFWKLKHHQTLHAKLYNCSVATCMALTTDCDGLPQRETR